MDLIRNRFEAVVNLGGLVDFVKLLELLYVCLLPLLERDMHARWWWHQVLLVLFHFKGMRFGLDYISKRNFSFENRLLNLFVHYILALLLSVPTFATNDLGILVILGS